MQNDKINLSLVLPIGLMLFSFFFGAGNLIFPPILGQMSGENLTAATIGFCLTGVGFPLLGILAMAINRSDSPESMGLPVGKMYARIVAVLAALTIGPFFAIPRTAAVSFDTGILSMLPDGFGTVGLAIYSIFFFGLTYFLSINPSQIVSNIGKIMTPMLLLCLGILLFFVITDPMGPLQAAQGSYQTHAFFKGFQEGYNTMDLLAAILFGAATVTTIERTGVKDQSQLTRLCIYAGLIAASCLALIYAALSYAGAVSTAALGIIPNGGLLLNTIAVHYMGFAGNIVLALIIFFACITTSIGLTTAIAEYFAELSNGQMQYQRLVIYICLFSLVVSNFGLNNIIVFSLPVIFTLYPIIIALVILNAGRSIFHGDKTIFRVTMTLTTITAIFDGLKVAGLTGASVEAFLDAYLPLYDIGFGWVVPCFGGIVIGFIISKILKK